MGEIVEASLENGTSPYVTKDQPWSSHAVIFHWLAEMQPTAIGLDIGTATGMFGQVCQQIGLTVDGIEPHPVWAVTASPLYRRFHNAPVEQIPAELLGGYDFMIFGDVLEHMPDPQRTLTQLVQLQNPGCLFLISVPNVANIWVRLNLLFGKFDYSDRGLLDRTHLHFYTRKTFNALLQSVGLEIIENRVTPIPLPLISPFFQRNFIGRLAYGALYGLTLLFPRLFGYQFVVKAVQHTDGVRQARPLDPPQDKV